MTISLRIARPDWMDRGACIHSHPDLFFPERDDGSPRVAAAAKAICATCPVIDECRAYGMNERYGVWGGMTHTDRKNYKRQRRRGAVPKNSVVRRRADGCCSACAHHAHGRCTGNRNPISSGPPGVFVEPCRCECRRTLRLTRRGQ